MDYSVYILYSQKRSRYYVGQRDDIKKRLIKHNKGLVPSTKYGVPWDLIHIQKINNRSEALILERKIKKRGAKRNLKDNHSGCSVARLSRHVWDAEVVTLEA